MTVDKKLVWLGAASAAVGLLAPLSWFGVRRLDHARFDGRADSLGHACYRSQADMARDVRRLPHCETGSEFMCVFYEPHVGFSHPPLDDECP